MQQTHLALAAGALHVVEDAAAARAPHHEQVQLREPDARFLGGGLGIILPILRGIGQGEGGAVDDLHHPAVPSVLWRDAIIRQLRALLERGGEQRLRQPSARLTVGAVRVVDGPLRAEPELGLQLADDLPAGGVALQHLPQETPPSAAHRVGPLARTRLRGIEGRNPREPRAEKLLQLVEGAAPQIGVDDPQRGAGRAGEAAAPSGKERSVEHRAVYLPPD